MTTPMTLAEPKSAARTMSASGAGSADAGGAITPAMLESFRGHFESNPAYRLALNAVTQTSIDNIALNRDVVTSTDFTFTHLLDDWAVTNQKKSGRCWMFAGLNLFRAGAMKKMNLKEFEFSQNFTLFWDKFERSNYFLEAIIETADRPVDERTVAFLLERPLEDGGQWNMFINVVKKHGLVPKAAMPETESSSCTMKMNSILLMKLREAAMTLRDLRRNGAPMEAVRAAKNGVMQVIYRILCIHLGTPPDSIDWQWNDKDRKFHRDGVLTPREFAGKYVELPLDDYVCLVNDPRETSPFGRTFTVQYLGNVVGGTPVKYLNVPIGVMKDVAMRTIMDGEPVWFGCDVGKMMRKDLGLWDAALYDFERLYGTSFALNKEQRLLYHQTQMTHAMLFTGVDVPDGTVAAAAPRTPRRWRVENSWGEEDSGRKGFYTMNDSWFDEYMFEIAARRDRLPADLREAIEQDPIVLPAWDPMGALAG
jgi:bleomycin hydrolase